MRAAKRKRLRETPLEPERVAIIARRFPTFARLSEDDQRELLGHVQVFLDEKNFEGCGGLEITDEIKLTIAAQACLLLLHRDTDYYPGLDSILVYPHAYRAPTRVPVGGRLAIETDQARLGESHHRGIVVLSWDAIARKSDESGYRETRADDGRNVVLHELAHQLDQEDGAADGVPVLAHSTKYGPWARVFQTEFDELVKETERGRETDIDAYGATNPAEFFAVVTEAFFETPETLAKNHPRLYAELADYYRQDPLTRLGLVFEPPPIEEEKVQEEPPSEAPLALSGDVTLNILQGNSAAKLVGVTPEFRDAVVAIGCNPCGYLSSIHKFRRGRGARPWGFVAEVFACPDPSVVAATYSISVFGDGVAFWTLLDNGTIIDTETAQRATWLFRFLNRISPRDRGEHVFIRTWAESPARLYARHLDRVRGIAKRENATPVVREAIETYAACRLRTTDLLSMTLEHESRLAMPIGLGLFFVVGMAVLAYFPFSNGVFALAMAAAFFVAALFSPLIASFIENMRVRGKPRSVDTLFAAAAERVKHGDARHIASIVHPNKKP